MCIVKLQYTIYLGQHFVYNFLFKKCQQNECLFEVGILKCILFNNSGHTVLSFSMLYRNKASLLFLLDDKDIIIIIAFTFNVRYWVDPTNLI